MTTSSAPVASTHLRSHCAPLTQFAATLAGVSGPGTGAIWTAATVNTRMLASRGGTTRACGQTTSRSSPATGAEPGPHPDADQRDRRADQDARQLVPHVDPDLASAARGWPGPGEDGLRWGGLRRCAGADGIPDLGDGGS